VAGRERSEGSDSSTEEESKHGKGSGFPDGDMSMPGLQEAADWMRNLTTSTEVY